MAFNTAKCKVMHCGSNNPCYEYRMGGNILEQTEEERDIGVTVTRGLKPAKQCAKAAQTAGAVLGQVTRAFHYRDRHTFVKLYQTYVRPHLEFASPAWNPWLEGDIECLEKIQRRAISMVSGLGGQSYEEKLKSLHLTTLRERRHRADMAQVFKILTGRDKVKSETWFRKADEQQRRARGAAHEHSLRASRVRLDVRKNFFSQRVVDDWNQIPDAIKDSVSVNSFKKSYADFRDSTGTGS